MVFEIKPALYQFDEDQTYDLIILASIYEPLLKVFKSQTFYKGSDLTVKFRDIDYPDKIENKIQLIFLVERFTRWNYPWAEDYSTKLFNFFKKYGGTDYYAYDRVIGKKAPIFSLYRGRGVSDFEFFEQPYNYESHKPQFGNEFNNNYVIDLTSYSTKSLVEIELPKTEKPQSVVITYLMDSGSDYTKSFRILTSRTNFVTRYSLSFEGNEDESELKFVPCSLVVSALNTESNLLKNLVENFFNAASLGYLYNNLNQLLGYLDSEILNQYPRLFKIVTSVSLTAKDANQPVSLTYEDKPSWYGDGSIIYANNNYWNNTSLARQDINVDQISYYPDSFSIHIYTGDYRRIPYDLPYAYNRGDRVLNLTLSYDNLSRPSAYRIADFSEPGFYPGFQSIQAFTGRETPIIEKEWGSWHYVTNSSGEVNLLNINEDYSISVQPEISIVTPTRKLRKVKWINPYPPDASISSQEYKELLDNYRDMPDSIRIKEIHAALQAEKFAYDEKGDERIANLGYYVERIARVLGINVNDDGTIRSIRQKKSVLAGNPLPDGWNFGQWGLNKGGHDSKSNAQEGGTESEYRDGIIYEQRCNILRKSAFGDPVVTSGDYTLCENFPQLIDEILDDLDKALGWQELGANFIPNADNSGKYVSYEGLAQLQTEVAYMLSRMSQHTSQTQVAVLIVQAVAYELLRATGQPVVPKAFQADVGGEDYANVPYPGLASDAPSHLQQTGWILQTIAPILGALLKPKIENSET